MADEPDLCSALVARSLLGYGGIVTSWASSVAWAIVIVPAVSGCGPNSSAPVTSAGASTVAEPPSQGPVDGGEEIRPVALPDARPDAIEEQRRWPPPMQAMPGDPPPAVYYDPEATGRTPLTVFLHGMCAAPEWECPLFINAAENSWLLCPRGPSSCGGAGAMWGGADSTIASRLDEVLHEFTAEKSQIDDRRALIGYSLGAVAVMRIVRKQPQRWHRLMIVNASVTPAPSELRSTAVERVAFVSGSGDATVGKLRAAATRLDQSGIRSEFFVLEDTGHYFTADTASRLAEPLSWLLDGWGTK